MSNKIKHVVHLVFENGSFDRSLGCFQEIYPEMEGIVPNSPPRSNADADGKKYFQIPTEEIQMPKDPMHEHENVLKQLKDDNSGFILDFCERYKDSTPDEKQLVMSYFPLGFLPALHTLARNFTICDHWFSSVPGPTWPNRFFCLSGSSNGLVVMPSNLKTLKMLYMQSQPTIFSRLTEANKAWKVYFHDVPCSLILQTQLAGSACGKYFEFDQFLQDCKGEEESFPEYAFIEPKYYGLDQNDDHPPHNVMKAQKLMADVYNAIRANPKLWESTLLVITYDEHGGFYDHVKPPVGIPSRPKMATDEYSFDLLGIRVPTLLISPWVKKGVENNIFDHTSLLKYLVDKWSLGDLGERVKNAKSISIAIRQDGRPRTDVPDKIAFDNTLLETGDRALEANPTGHHFAADLAVALFSEHAGRELVRAIAERSRTGKKWDGAFTKLVVGRLLLFFIIEYAVQFFRGKDSKKKRKELQQRRLREFVISQARS